MKTFAYDSLIQNISSKTTWSLLSSVLEDRGKMELVHSRYSSKLDFMRQMAFFDSVESSACIEGIYLDRKQIEKIVGGQDKPNKQNSKHSRSSVCGQSESNRHDAPKEQGILNNIDCQIAGYARVLKTIQYNCDTLPVSSSSLLAMYATLFGYQNNQRSLYRSKDYQNMMGADNQVVNVRVSPINAFETPLYVGSLCDNLARVFDDPTPNYLLVVPYVCVDLMCIRPFDKGTGRIMRLFSLLLTEKLGFDIAQYVSIDKLFYESGMSYYDALNDCVEGWDVGANFYDSFVHYWLDILHRAYQILFDQTIFCKNENKIKKSQQVAACFDNVGNPLTKKDIVRMCPEVSMSTIESVLHKLLIEKKITMIGKGRSTSYVLKEDK